MFPSKSAFLLGLLTIATTLSLVLCGGGTFSQRTVQRPTSVVVTDYGSSSSGESHGRCHSDGHVSMGGNVPFANLSLHSSQSREYGHVEGERRCACKRFRLMEGGRMNVNGQLYDTVVPLDNKGSSYSTVYHAHHKGTCFAIKEDAPKNEYLALNACKGCANVVQLIDSQELNNKRWRLVLELAEMSLVECIDAQLLSKEQLVAQAKDALRQIRDHNVSHNDVKVFGNWMVFKNNGRYVMKLIDFGRATMKKSSGTEERKQLLLFQLLISNKM